MNIIIPIGGVGKRFSSDGYNLPKPLIRTLGEHLIVECINSLSIGNEDILYLIYRDELQKFNFESILHNKFPLIKFKFLCINFDTRGASETVLQCLVNMSDSELNELTIIVDSDNLYKDDIIGISKKYNDNLIFYHKSIEEKPIFSYIKIENNKVTEIKEKIKITNNACIGAYCFKNASLLKDTIIDMIKIGDKTLNEFYVSNIYKKLLESNTNILAYKVNNYICLGTPEQMKISSSNLSKSSKKRFCFDLDNTLVTYPRIKNDYTSVEPIKRNIDYLKFLYNQGHEIIIHTARRMKTHYGNVGRLQADIGRVTFDTLEKFKIPYHEIYFGKPYADFYIDDLAVKSYDNLEKETGFYNIHPDTRSHNKMEVFDEYIIKYSSNIDGEKFWYENIPKPINRLFPSIISSDDNSITLSKIKGIPLSYLNINKTLTKDLLIKVLDSISEIHNSSQCDLDIDIYDNYINKLQDRIYNYDFSKYENFDVIYSNIKEFLINYEKNNLGKIGVIHGDPVFTNILLDNNNNLFFIDMRGKIANSLTIYGDIFYDYAKIYQSIIGYDFILMDKEIDNEYIKSNTKIFEDYINDKFGTEKMYNIKQITKSLLLSLIPIHNNSKCENFYKLI